MDDLFKMYEKPEPEQHWRCHTVSRCAGRMQMAALPSLNHQNFTKGRIYFHRGGFFTLYTSYIHTETHKCV